MKIQSTSSYRGERWASNNGKIGLKIMRLRLAWGKIKGAVKRGVEDLKMRRGAENLSEGGGVIKVGYQW